MLSEISKIEKDKYHMVLLICRTLKKKEQIEPNMVMVTRGEDGEGEMVEGFSFMVTDGTFQW